jgi:hypothetical protein
MMQNSGTILDLLGKIQTSHEGDLTKSESEYLLDTKIKATKIMLALGFDLAKIRISHTARLPLSKKTGSLHCRLQAIDFKGIDSDYISSFMRVNSDFKSRLGGIINTVIDENDEPLLVQCLIEFETANAKRAFEKNTLDKIRNDDVLIHVAINKKGRPKTGFNKYGSTLSYMTNERIVADRSFKELVYDKS